MKSRVNVWRQRAVMIAACVLFLIANAAFLIGFRSITAKQAQSLEDRRSTLMREVVASEAEAAKLGSERDRLSKVSSVVEEFYGRRVGTRRETLAPVVEEIHSVMRRVGVTPKSISYSIASVSNLPLSQMVIAFAFRSDYARFKRLLYAFEANRRWIVVREIGLTRDGETPHVRIFAELRPSTVVLKVADRGIGIERKYHERIFRIFERLHGYSKYPGSGVGLAIARRRRKQ